MALASDTLRNDQPRAGRPHIPPPPTPDEETDLLTLAVEYRRLKDHERDLALKSPSLQPPPLPSVRAAAAGYGDDIGAYETALVEGQKARDALVTRNMGLVHHVVNSIVGGGSSSSSSSSPSKGGGGPRRTPGKKLNSLSRDDLIQEGAIGLARAVDRYDPNANNGARFATYAVYWIRAAVLRCIAERDDLVRVPEYVSASVRRMSAAAARLGLDVAETELLGVVVPNAKRSSEVAWREAERAKLIAEEAGLTDRQYDDAVAASRRRRGGGYTSFEPWMQAKGANKRAVAVTPSGDTTDDTQEIKRVLSEFLKPKEMEALSLRYGLGDPLALSSGSVAAPTPAPAPRARARPRPQAPQQFRDYEDEALEGLFGDGGILATSSSSPAPSTLQPTRTKTSSRQKSTTTKAAVPKTARAVPPLPQGGRWGEAMSFAEVGQSMAVSAEYGRRLCSQALKKLRVAAEEGRLEEGRLGLLVS